GGAGPTGGLSAGRGRDGGPAGLTRGGPWSPRWRGRYAGEPRRGSLRAINSAIPPIVSSHTAIFTSTANGEPVNGSVPVATPTTPPVPRPAVTPSTSTLSKRFITVMPCVGVFAVRLNFPLSSGEKL